MNQYAAVPLAVASIGRRAGQCSATFAPSTASIPIRQQLPRQMNDETHATYARELPEYTSTDTSGYATHVPAIFWRHGDLDLIDRGHFYLSRTLDVPSADWGVEYPLGVSWVRLRLREGGGEIVHMNAQFEDGPSGRSRG